MRNQNSRPTTTAVDKFKSALLSDSTKNYLKQVLPATVSKYLTPERMGRVALATISRTPTLWQCRPESIVRAIVDAASVGLEPTGGVLAHGYLVPYKDQCQFIIGYQGLVELARRSGNFEYLEANPVFERDTLVLRYGFNADFSHEPYMGSEDRGPLVGAYCMAVFKNGERHVTYMSKADIDKRRAASKAGQSGPWRDWYEEMAVKTVIKKAAKLWPKTVEIANAFDIDAKAEDGDVVLDMPLLSSAPEEPKDKNDELLDRLQGEPSQTAVIQEDTSPQDVDAAELEARRSKYSANRFDPAEYDDPPPPESND